MLGKNHLTLLLVLAAGAGIGGLLGDSLQASQILGGATDILVRKYQVLTIPPSTMDLYVAKVMAGFEFSPNLAAILGMILVGVLLHKL